MPHMNPPSRPRPLQRRLSFRLVAIVLSPLVSLGNAAVAADSTAAPAVSGNVVTVVQRLPGEVNLGQRAQTRANYRGDLSGEMPAGQWAGGRGLLFGQIRFGQGLGVAAPTTYTGAVNSTVFQVGSGAVTDGYAVLAQAGYQWTQPLPASQVLQLTLGKIDPFGHFDQNAIADDEGAQFLNNIFVHNPLLDSGGDVGGDAHGFTPGAVLRWSGTHPNGAPWAASFGVMAAGDAAAFHGSIGRPLVMAQLASGWRRGDQTGQVRVLTWRNAQGEDIDNSSAVHAGWGLSIDQPLGPHLQMFLRWGQQTRGQVRFDRALTLGAEVAGTAWGRQGDALGAAWGALRTSDHYRRLAPTLDLDGDGHADPVAHGRERTVEVFYRWQLNGALTLSPDIQWVHRPAAQDTPSIRVYGLRASLAF